MKKVLFLDRDGVVNVDHGYLYQPEKFEFIDGVFDACTRFQQAGFDIVIVTNQSGIGRGYYTEQDFHTLTEWMCQQFKVNGITILDVYYCPHHPKKANPPYLLECDCRKPEPGMILKAIAEHNIDPKSSIMVGDKKSDMLAADKAGIAQKYLVLSGQSLTKQDQQSADAIFNSLPDAAEHVLKS